jgi:hypothetical protein
VHQPETAYRKSRIRGEHPELTVGSMAARIVL